MLAAIGNRSRQVLSTPGHNKVNPVLYLPDSGAVVETKNDGITGRLGEGGLNGTRSAVANTRGFDGPCRLGTLFRTYAQSRDRAAVLTWDTPDTTVPV